MAALALSLSLLLSLLLSLASSDHDLERGDLIAHGFAGLVPKKGIGTKKYKQSVISMIIARLTHPAALDLLEHLPSLGFVAAA